ncbi:MAG: bifunctional folylpolyglutamate synthase/dihydrofolate synthase [Chloroflexota bacterium]
MRYSESVDKLLGLADFERKSRSNDPPDFHLRRMEALLGRVGDPHLGTPTVHVAGSKGKGSTAAMVASALDAARLKTGLYTSPHLHRFTERIRVGQTHIDEASFAALVEELWPHVGAVSATGEVGRVSVFELLTAMAFQHFHACGADAQVIEVGLGGRLDATNVVNSDVSVITPVSLDHVAVLGDTVPQIAAEKAGIVKPGVPVVVGRQLPEARAVIERVAAERGARLVDAFQQVQLLRAEPLPRSQQLELQGEKGRYDINLPLLGEHQVENAITAIAALEVFDGERGSATTASAAQRIADGLGRVEWPCRAEILSEAGDGWPMIVVDGAHNEASAAAFVRALRRHFPDAPRVTLIYAGSGGHDYGAAAREFAPLDPDIIVTKTRHPKAVSPDAVAEALRCDNLRVVETTHSVTEALAALRRLPGPSPDLVAAAGSLFVAAEVREAVKGIEPELYPDLRGGLKRPLDSFSRASA